MDVGERRKKRMQVAGMHLDFSSKRAGEVAVGLWEITLRSGKKIRCWAVDWDEARHLAVKRGYEPASIMPVEIEVDECGGE